MRTDRSSPSITHLRCPPPELRGDESTEETLARYQQALVDLAQCFDDELTIRPESSLLNRVVIKILLPFAAATATLSALYTRGIFWADRRFRYAEEALGIAQLLLALVLIGVWLLARKTDRFPRVRRFNGHVRAYLESQTPRRNETLTRNHFVNDWIYFWFVVGAVVFIPTTYFVLRANAFDRLGMEMLVEAAGICRRGSDAINAFRDSSTCASITGISPASSHQQAKAAEIRLDATTALALYAILLAAGILVSMAIWWRHN